MSKLVRDLIEPLVLKFLADQPSYGYCVMAYFKKTFNVELAPSVVYPLLNNLAVKGFVVAHWDMSVERPRKVFTIAPAGMEALESFLKELEALTRKLGVAEA